MARRDRPCLTEFAEGIHTGQHIHSHLNIQVLGFLDLSYFWVYGASLTNKYGWHRDGHNKASASQIIQRSLNAKPLDANSVVTEDAPLTAEFADSPFREWLVSYCLAVAYQKAVNIAPRQIQITESAAWHWQIAA